MALRIPLALVLASVITFGLFWTMQALVGVTGEFKEGHSSGKIEFVRLRRDTTPETKKREPPTRQKPEQAPPPPDISMSKASLEPTGEFGSIGPDINAGEALSGGIGTAAGADRDATPMVRIEPEYPMRMRQRRVEGWVAVGFTISKAGTVKDAYVESSDPPGAFDKAALAAVRRWKYNPKIVNGAPVERPGQKVLFPFTMED